MKNIPYILKFVLLSSILFSTLSCQNEELKLTIKTIQTYGDNNEIIIGNITDIDFYNKVLYILDSQQKIIFKFNITGKLLGKIILRRGRGPGEFTMGLFSFKVLNDSLIAVQDQLLKSIQLISNKNTGYRYIRSIKLNFNPYKIFYRDSSLYISGNAIDYVIYVFDINGNFKRKIQPQFLLNSQPTPWYPELTIDEDNSIYIANPYKTEIIKWNKVEKWKYIGEENLISPPVILGRGGMGQLKGWSNLLIFKKYLIASTYNMNRNKEGKNLPQIIVLNKKNGEFILQKSVTHSFKAKAYLNGKYVFKLNYEPFPSVSMVKLIIK